MGVSTAASVRGSIQERPKAVVFMVALYSRTRSLKDVNFTRHRRVFAKTFLPVLPERTVKEKSFVSPTRRHAQIITARSEEKPMAIREIKRTSLLPHRTRAA